MTITLLGSTEVRTIWTPFPRYPAITKEEAKKLEGYRSESQIYQDSETRASIEKIDRVALEISTYIMPGQVCTFKVLGLSELERGELALRLLGFPYYLDVSPLDCVKFSLTELRVKDLSIEQRARL